ncbi:MAG: InlB B-repeat-containing protein, partial [Clostridiales bacterium]|nr:InlB B-repeat-containing protein [Clostridiales bacterium]
TKKLSQVMAPLYTIMKTTPKMFVLDDNDNMIHIEAVSNMLKSTYNYYQWRFCENDGELYVTTFDTSILFEHVIDISLSTLLKTFLQVMAPELMDLKNNLTRVAMPERNTLLTATNCLLNLAKINELTDLQIDEALASIALLSSSGKNIDIPATLRTLLKTVDAEGIRMLMEMRSRLKTSAGGFDVFKTSDGESWSMILDDGCNDRFNYGGRTIINHKSQLYIATANPFFGSQLWRLTKTVKTPYVKPEKPEGGAPQAAEAIANTYTIALNPNRGELDNVVLTTSTDGTLENLPIPERENYSFAGWYNAPTGGSLVDTNTVFIADTTLYAMWKLIRPEYTLDTVSTLSDKAIAAINGTRHIIQVTASEGGRVSPEGIKIIVKGGRLTVTAFPNEGYSIASFIVDGEDKGNIFYYTFKNIKENHRVEVVFVK